ncbi:MAG: S8 family serine peptidase, partial [Halioglobus sp.]|nr:S8 family serine peptidase [Halioglobus sp.]
MMLTATQSFVQHFRADRALCLLVLLLTSAHSLAEEFVVTPANPPALSLAQQKDRCKDLWIKGRAYVEADLAELLTQIGKDRSQWQAHDAKRVGELTEELLSIRATLAYCDATFTAQDKTPQPDGVLGPVTRPDWGGARNTPGAGDVDFSVLFVSTRCELCRKQVREMNDWILVNLKISIIRNYLWGNAAAPGETQNEAVRRTDNREQDTAYFQNEYAERLAALRLCEDLYCASHDKATPPATGNPAMPSDTATAAAVKEPYKYFTEDTHCRHPDCLFLAEQLAQRNPIYTSLMDSIISQEEQLEEAGAALKNCGGCPAAEISRLIKVRDSIYRDLAALRERRQPLWTEMVNLDADLQECEKKWCSRSSIYYDPRYEIDTGQGFPGPDAGQLLDGLKPAAQPPPAGPAEEEWGAFSPDFKYTLPGRAFLTQERTPRVTYPVGANGAAVFDRDEKPAPPGKSEPAVARSSQQPAANSRGAGSGIHGRLLVGLDDALMAQLAARQPAEVLVAVIDSGADFRHPDLAGALWQNPGERYNYRDDDGNGLIENVSGWNYIAQNEKTQDDNGHGTLVAGIIASRGDATDSVAGVNPWARILPIKATNSRGDGNSVGVAAALTEAVNRGARVINISLGGNQFAAAEKYAVEYANDKGALVVVAAGNQNIDTQAFWPAGLDNVITVAALDAGGQRAAYSNWGGEVDIAAPGSNILSLRAWGTDPLALADETYEDAANIRGAEATLYISSGTSFAAPFVAGAASLLYAVNPELTAAQVRNMLLNSAADIGAPGVDPLTGYGRLDAAAALAADPDFFVTAHISGIASERRNGAVVVSVKGSADANRFRRARVELG